MTRCQGSDCKYYEKIVLMVEEKEIQDPLLDMMPTGICERIDGALLNPNIYQGKCELYEVDK